MVEVKTRSSVRYGTPEEAIDTRKERALDRFVGGVRLLFEWRGPIRLAVLALVVTPEGRVLEHRLQYLN